MSITEHQIKSFLKFTSVNILRNALGLIRSKVIAIWYGGLGVGILGQYVSFFNLQSKILLFGATASIINSHNKAIRESWNKQLVLLYHLLIILVTNILGGLFLILFSNKISTLIFDGLVDNNFVFLMVLVGLIYSAGMYLELLVQARKEFSKLFKGQVYSSIFAILTLIPIIFIFGIKGILYNFIIFYLISFLFFLSTSALDIHELSRNHVQLNIKILKYILKVSLIDIARSILVIGSLLVGRIFIVKIIGIQKTGYLQSILSITNYINVLSMGFMIYYFPTISSKLKTDDFSNEFNSGFKLLIYFVFPFIILIYLFPDIFIKLLYTKEFLIVKNFLPILMISKVIEIYNYFYGINFLGTNRLGNFILLDGLKSIIFLLLLAILLSKFQIIGIVYSFLGAEITAFLSLKIILKKITQLQLKRENNILYYKILLLLILLNFLDINIFLKILISLSYSILLLDLKTYFELISIFRKK